MPYNMKKHFKDCYYKLIVYEFSTNLKTNRNHGKVARNAL